MTIHMSARLAWHMDGWNGNVCQNPAANTYCTWERAAYPRRDDRRAAQSAPGNGGRRQMLHQDQAHPSLLLQHQCFPEARTEVKAFSEPPDFFKDDTLRAEWDLAPATVCLWPYEVMYGDDVKDGAGYDYEQRLTNAREYFSQFKEDSSLIIYYANYSNPLNQDERRYVIVGISRIKRIGKIRYFENCSDRVREKYAGGFIWQCDVTSHYPDEGLRLPYHRYLDKPEILEQFTFFPENPQRFKFAHAGTDR